jgi:DNA-binding transcriptional regulator YbjK
MTIHSRIRLAERYGIPLERSTHIFKQIRDDIQAGRARFIRRQSNSVTIWRARLDNDRHCTVVYSKARKSIITVY